MQIFGFDIDRALPLERRKTVKTAAEVVLERQRQDEKWGEQNHPNNTGISDSDRRLADRARIVCDNAAADGTLTWRHILGEEVFEAFAESDPALLRVELIQVAAVATAWVEAIDRAQNAQLNTGEK